MLLLLHLLFTCGVAGYAGILPIWEEVSRVRGRTEGLSTLNQTILRVIPSCWRVFGGRAHFSASLPLFAFVKNMSLMNPSLDPLCDGGAFTPLMTLQGTLEASTHGESYASLLAHHMDGQLASVESLQTAAQVHLALILSVDEVFRNLKPFPWWHCTSSPLGVNMRQKLQSSFISFRDWSSSTPRYRV